MSEFVGFPKVARLSRYSIVTEKIDGTNAQIYIEPCGEAPTRLEPLGLGTINGVLHGLYAGSRSRWVRPGDDNHGFAAWASANLNELFKLGPGRHFGEWWGRGIQRGYGLDEKRFSLFNVTRWALYGTEPKLIPTQNPLSARLQDVLPECCGLVPVLGEGQFDTVRVDSILWRLYEQGSVAAPGFRNPEGVMVYHTVGQVLFKKTLKNDHAPKGGVSE